MVARLGPDPSLGDWRSFHAALPKIIGVLLGVLGGAAAPPKSEIFRLSEILGCRTNVFLENIV